MLKIFPVQEEYLLIILSGLEPSGVGRRNKTVNWTGGLVIYMMNNGSIIFCLHMV